MKRSSIIIYSRYNISFIFEKLQQKPLEKLPILWILKVPRTLRFLVVLRIQPHFHPMPKGNGLSRSERAVKKQDTVDKRAVLISLTDKAEKVHYESWKQIYNNFTSNLEKLSEEDQRDLTYGLYKINKMLSKMLNND
ncbi:MarR family transcriptional regulator [Bacillus mycoides]|uniref:MarR family transcriptional regulator n=1 Tax=Bacillus mycoides TaxID=1405 RepID=UPI0035CADA70